MHYWNRRALIATGVAALALTFVGCGDGSDQGGAQSGGDKRAGKQEQKKSSEPKRNPYSGLARWEHQAKGMSAPDKIVFLDPKDGSPKAALELAFDEYLVDGTIAPDGRFVGLQDDGTLQMFEPNQKTGRYQHVRAVEVEQSYSDAEPRLQVPRFGPDGDRIYLEGHYDDAESATFSVAFDKGPIEEETKLPESPAGFWPAGDEHPDPWHILPDGSVGAIESDTMTRQEGDKWISESWTTDSGEVYAAAALVPGENGNDPEDGYFSYARLGENRFLAEYVKTSFESADGFLAVLEVDPDSGAVDVTPALEKPSGGVYPKAILSPDGKRLVVSTSRGEMYVANLGQSNAEPRPLENLPKEDDVGESKLLGWL